MTKPTIDEFRAKIKKLSWPREYRERGKVELRASDDGRTISMFIPFGSDSVDMGFREIIERGAFTRSIRAGRSSQRNDIFALWSHDASQPLARQATGTLEFEERDDGLAATATLMPEIDYHQRTLQLVKAGLARGTSFGFETVRDDWEFDEAGNATRHLEEVKLFEVSPVVFPAYQESEARSNLALVREAAGVDLGPLLEILREAKDGKVPAERRDVLDGWIGQLRGFMPEVALPEVDYSLLYKKVQARERHLKTA